MRPEDLRLILVLLWRANVASATATCDDGIIVACTVGTFAGCMLIFGAVLLTRWAQSRRRRRAMFETDLIKSYAKVPSGVVNVAYSDEIEAVVGSDDVSTPNGRQGERCLVLPAKQTTFTKQLKISKGANEPEKRARKDAPDDLLTLGSQGHGEPVAVELISKDIIGLGFGIQGTYSDGIYVSEVHDRGPAKGTGLVDVGDRLVSVSVSMENMAYEDAVALLSYATPYRVTLHVLKRGSSSPVGNVGQRLPLQQQCSREGGRLRKKERSSMSSSTLRHPAFFGRSQSLDKSREASCNYTLPRRLGLQLSLGSAAAKITVPPPKPKRAVETNGPSSSSRSSPAHRTQSTAIAEVTPITANAALLTSASGSSMHSLRNASEEPLPSVTITPTFLGSEHVFRGVDSLAYTAESSLLEDINRVLSHEKQDSSLSAINSSPLPADTRSKEQSSSQEAMSTTGRSPPACAAAGAAAAICGAANGSMLAPLGDASIDSADESEGSSSVVIEAQLHSPSHSNAVLGTSAACQLTSPQAAYRSDSSSGDELYPSYEAGGVERYQGTEVLPFRREGVTNGHFSQSSDFCGQARLRLSDSESRPHALPVNQEELDSPDEPVLTPPSPISSHTSSDDYVYRAPVSNSVRTGSEGFTIVGIQREVVKPGHDIGAAEIESDGDSLASRTPTAWEANGFHWCAESSAYTTPRVGSNGALSGCDDDISNSDPGSAASATSVCGSEDGNTPQPLRKFGNFANLSNDVLDEDSNFHGHMADRDSVSSENSTPVNSETTGSPTAFAYAAVDENLNPAPKGSARQLEDGAGQRGVGEATGTRRSIEEARALFFAELLRRSTH